MIAALFLACTGTCVPLPPPPAEPLQACTATDGDTIRCGDERIRLLGIDTPEMPGHCRKGRTCVAGDPLAARRALVEGMALGALTVRRTGRDRYGRTLGLVEATRADGRVINLSCRQIERGGAAYVRNWDDRRMVARACPALAVVA